MLADTAWRFPPRRKRCPRGLPWSSIRPMNHKTHKIYMREAYLDGALSDAAARLARAFSPVGGMVLPNGRGLF
jgi:hypothetical protein